MFGKKKSPQPSGTSPLPRGRRASADSGGAHAGSDNPLARRLQPDSEPRTVDLAEPARFHTPTAAEDDPRTATLRTDTVGLSRVVSRDPETGKLYLHPGADDLPVELGGEAIVAPTELRPGDRIRIGQFEIHLQKTP